MPIEFALWGINQLMVGQWIVLMIRVIFLKLDGFLGSPVTSF
jgi:hypothetical protein